MKLKLVFLIAFLGAGVVLIGKMKSPKISGLKSLNSTTTNTSNSDAAYDQVMKVLMHPRCINCHPSDDIPKQGIEGRPHYFDMARGKEDSGFEATNCNTCHQSENNLFSGVPGAPHWALAPASMAWEGLTKRELAERLLDKNTNGNRSHKELVEHMTMDDLVLWAWNPGVDANGIERELPPVSKEDFKKAVTLWFENGAVIPTK